MLLSFIICYIYWIFCYKDYFDDFFMFIDKLYPLPNLTFRSGILPIHLKLPDIKIPTREHNTWAYYKEWVVRTITFPALLFKIISQSCLLCSGSSPDAGSSSNTIRGEPDKAMAIDSLLFIPPEREETLLSSRLFKSTFYNILETTYSI